MLVEIMCDEFKDHGTPRGRIQLHAGLNTVMGSSSGSNSIGKSTFLMIIDFVFGEAGRKILCKRYSTKSRMALESRADSGLNPLFTESHGGQNGMRAGTA